MKLYLYGHDYKYAAEQMLLTLFPGQRPEYPQGRPEGDRVELRLSRGSRYVTASCKLYRGAEVFYGRSAVDASALKNKLLTDRYGQRLIKNALYRAALASGLERPVWGALTGVRPGKVLSPLLLSCATEGEALGRFIRDYDVSPDRARLCLDTSRVTLAAKSQLGANDVCLYVGIPFCPTRCSYCSFVSQAVGKTMALIPEYLEALDKELIAAAEQINKLGLRLISIYMGGGTPTTLSAEQLDWLCGRIGELLDLSSLREYSVEAGRPDTITEEKLRVLRRRGVDRVSVNPQTMSDDVLELIGRKHSAADILRALGQVRKVGGFAVNMDLIAGLPGDTAAGFSRSLDTVLSLSPENITVHTLSIKKGSSLTAQGGGLPPASEVKTMLDSAGERLRGEGYQPYYLYRQKFMSGGFENVGWTQSGYANLYNICIMEELCSIIACGGGGSTKLVRQDGGRDIRIMAPKYPQEYIGSIAGICAEKEKISEFYSEVRRNDNGI